MNFRIILSSERRVGGILRTVKAYSHKICSLFHTFEAKIYKALFPAYRPGEIFLDVTRPQTRKYFSISPAINEIFHFIFMLWPERLHFEFLTIFFSFPNKNMKLIFVTRRAETKLYFCWPDAYLLLKQDLKKYFSMAWMVKIHA